MSSRNPGWMTPLVKCILRANSRIPKSSDEGRKSLDKRISEVKNGKNFLAARGHVSGGKGLIAYHSVAIQWFYRLTTPSRGA